MSNSNINDNKEVLRAMIDHNVKPEYFYITISGKNSLRSYGMFQIRIGDAELYLDDLQCYEDGDEDYQIDEYPLKDFIEEAEKLGILDPLKFASIIMNSDTETLASIYWNADYFEDFEELKK